MCFLWKSEKYILLLKYLKVFHEMKVSEFQILHPIHDLIKLSFSYVPIPIQKNIRCTDMNFWYISQLFISEKNQIYNADFS